MLEKYIEWDNPFDKSGKTRLKILRETKTQYIAQCNENAFRRFRKPNCEFDGAYVRSVNEERWAPTRILRIIDNKGAI